MRATRVFESPEPMVVPVTDDIHPWKRAFVGVMAHPFFSVTDSSGTFEINGVPPGDYTVEAWHEKLGILTQRVTILAGQTTNLQFEFEPR